MDWGIVVGVIGAVATVVFGTLSVILVLRRRYPGEICALHQKTINLLDDVIKGLPEISVTYKDAPVDKGLTLLRCAFVNTGTKDITQEMVSEKVAVALPGGFRWLDARVVGASPDVDCVIENAEKELVFDMGLYRCSESVEWQAMIEGPRVPQFRELRFTHRIADTGRVVCVDAPSSQASASQLPAIGLLSSVAGLIVGSLSMFDRPVNYERVLFAVGILALLAITVGFCFSLMALVSPRAMRVRKALARNQRD